MSVGESLQTGICKSYIALSQSNFMRVIYHTANRKPRIERSQIARMNNQSFSAYSSSLFQRHIEATILLPKLLGYATLVWLGAFIISLFLFYD
ncbi:hypothetical protein [Dendronalium sp. ChiSLP03b]|uniref:hypothetical protein n=1 Tax=Dendronalium sp. ChiSLP03b TaxID=3075381 RepID=UPI002ADBB68A|nr:hypothetical protein [Dendronalium sp. ChiSLP03b]